MPHVVRTPAVEDLAVSSILNEAALHGVRPQGDMDETRRLLLAARKSGGWKHFMKASNGA